jgi:hypothetical protein
MERLTLENASPEQARSSAAASTRSSRAITSISATRARELRLRRIAENIGELEVDDEGDEEEVLEDAVRLKRHRPPQTAFQKPNSRFTEVNLLIARARKLVGTEERPGEGTQKQFENIQCKLKEEIEKTKQNRTEMMEEIARVRHNLRDRQKRHAQNQVLLPDLRDEWLQLHFETKDQEEATKTKAAAQIEQGKRSEVAKWVHPMARHGKGQELSEYQIAEEYLLKKIREVKLDIRRLHPEKSMTATM